MACLLVMSLLMVCGASSIASAAPRGRFDPGQVDRFLVSALDKIGFPGMAVVITHGARVVYLRGLGRDGHGQPVTERTQFRLASLSKSFTATAVLRLIEAGRVGLDVPVRAYVPDFATADAASSARITVRELLNQTSGMADAGFPAVASDQPTDVSGRVASLHRAVLVSPPGRQFHYFDPNYQVLARLVELVSGMPLGQYLRQQVLAPLQMNDTLSTATAAQGTREARQLAQGHILVFDAAVARAELDGLLAGSGGVISTAADMGGWLIVQTTGTDAHGRRLLDPAALTLMHAPPPGTASSYAMGWDTISPAAGQPRRIEHNGVLSTFSADQVLLPDSGYGFALLYNANSALADTAAVKAGLAALLTGDAASVTVRSTAVVAVVFAVLSIVVMALGVRALIGVRRWVARRAARRWWGLGPGAVWALAPLALLAGIPTLLLELIGRSFTFWQLVLSMPDPMIFLGLAFVTGLTITLARVIALTQHATRAP